MSYPVLSVEIEGLIRSEETTQSDFTDSQKNKVRRIATDAEVVVAIFEDQASADYFIVDLRAGAARIATGKRFIGVTGLVNGRPQTALLDDLNPEVINAISAAFVKYVITAASLCRNVGST
jgi:hypothetical protein